MKIGFEASILCRFCSPSMIDTRDVPRLCERSSCEGCVVEISVEPLLRQVADPGAAFLDPARQRAIRREIEAEYP
jgi:hypothetical protein